MSDDSPDDRTPREVRGRRANRLAEESSPYLLQHAHNPVDWYPWGEEALAAAKAADRPILLSVGYAACHWCHVMEQESFEDAATAALMNEHFVSVKVDREERPDIDSLYMEAVQAMTGGGGWPMTVFCTPQGEPFFAGTYFPKEDRFGMPAFRRVLSGISEAWTNDRERVLTQATKIVDAISQSAPGGSHAALSASVITEALAGLQQTFDAEAGGWGAGPKFPQAMTIDLLLRSSETGAVADMTTFTLDAMANGGVYDQLGGGFHRYAVDREWRVPHFEKMLYDNAQLARTYAHAWQVTGNADYRRVAVETLEYLLREMQHAGGGFFSSQDADSEGREGAFFAWSWNDLVGIVGEAGARAFGATPEGNWEGTNVLRNVSGGPIDAGIRRALFEQRKFRERPATDDKILASWNGLAITAFAEAGRIFDEPRYVAASRRAGNFLLASLRREDGRLLRSWREGSAGTPGFADDYALAGGAMLTLYEATFEMKFFDAARSFADDLLRLFADESDASRGFFQTGSDAEQLVIRPKELLDNAVPSGNSAAADLLLRLAAFTGHEPYERAAAGALEAVAGAMGRYPMGFGLALSALTMNLAPAREIAIIGDAGDPDTAALAAEVWKRFLPGRVLAVSSPEGVGAAASKGFALLDGRTMQDAKATAYVCERFVCQLPVTSPAELGALLDAGA